MGRISIMEANPFHAWNIGETFYQFGQRITFIQVKTVISQILRNHLELFHPLLHQQADFLLDIFHRNRLIMPRTDRNGTIGTSTVTPFRNLQIGIMPGSCQHTVGSQFMMIGFTQIVQQFLPVKLSIKMIDLRQFVFQVFQEAFGQASHYE